MQLGLVLLEDALVVIFPELFRGVLAGDPLEDLLATCTRHECPLAKDRFLAFIMGCARMFWLALAGIMLTWMIILELGEVIDILIDNNV